MSSTGLGIDGATGGWVVMRIELKGDAWIPKVGFSHTIEDIYRRWSGLDALTLIDIPIGLPTREAGRRCDTEARRLLGRPRGSSVFAPPVRGAFDTRARGADYRETSEANFRRVGKRITKQSWNIMEKISEVDSLLRSGMSPTAGQDIREAHPELLFWALNDKKACQGNKKGGEGRAERLEILERHCTGIRTRLQESLADRRRIATGPKPPAPDDIIDAAVCAVVAARYASLLVSLPAEPPRDTYGLPMEIVYPAL